MIELHLRDWIIIGIIFLIVVLLGSWNVIVSGIKQKQWKGQYSLDILRNWLIRNANNTAKTIYFYGNLPIELFDKEIRKILENLKNKGVAIRNICEPQAAPVPYSNYRIIPNLKELYVIIDGKHIFLARPNPDPSDAWWIENGFFKTKQYQNHFEKQSGILV